MNIKNFVCLALGAVFALSATASIATEAGSASAKPDAVAKLNGDARTALNQLYAKVPAAKTLGGNAAAVLVFPSITKAGLVVGGQYGKGVLFKHGQPVGYYSTGGASVGFTAGAEKFSYALFFMHEEALKQLDKADGFALDANPSLVFVDAGVAKSITTTTAKHDIYAFIFSQKGIMADASLQGSKVTKIEPK